MSDVTAAYEALLSQAKAMLGAAREDEWERVLELEQDYRRQAAHIRRLDEEALTEPALIQHKLQLVEALIEHDREIRQRADARRDELAELMRVTRQQGKLHRAYGGQGRR
ncbi:flagellar protein FliT [Halomonas sp. BC2]|uniref:flagellar protein FliT n=2 Tax=unclassified Halomonas TaxID=2609666 RepID=UPI001482D5D3|nr:flagellar protein FliT [Halomonas sp. BC2]